MCFAQKTSHSIDLYIRHGMSNLDIRHGMLNLDIRHGSYRPHCHPPYVGRYYLMGCGEPIHTTLDLSHTQEGEGARMAFLGWLCVSPNGRAHTHTPLAHVHAHCVPSSPRKCLRQYTPFPPLVANTLRLPQCPLATGARPTCRSHLAPFSLAPRSSVTGARGSATRERTVWCSAPL